MKNGDKLICINEINDYDFIIGNTYNIFGIINYNDTVMYGILDNGFAIVTLTLYELNNHFKLERISKLEKIHEKRR